MLYWAPQITFFRVMDTVKILAHIQTAPRLAILYSHPFSRATSKQRLESHSPSAAYLSLADTTINTESPSGKG